MSRPSTLSPLHEPSGQAHSPPPRRRPGPPRDALGDLLRRAAAVADRCAAHAHAVDATGAFPEQEFSWIREAGLLEVPLPTAQGGPGLGMEPATYQALYLLLRAIGQGSLPVGRIYEGHVNALLLVHRYGTPEQQARYAAEARAGLLFGVWNTEAEDGVRLHPGPGGRYRLEGAKTFASGAGHVLRPFVNGALPDGGWQMCIVPMDEVETRIDPSWWQAEGMRASASYRVDFTGVEVDQRALVGAPGDYTREPDFSGGAMRFAAVQLGGAQALFEAARTHLDRLNRLDHPHQQARLGEAAIHLESGALWLLGMARIQERPDVDAAAVVAYAQMGRTAIEAACLDVLRLVDRCVGARGLLPPSPIERIGRDLRLYLRQPATDLALTQAGRYAAEAPERPLGSDFF